MAVRKRIKQGASMTIEKSFRAQIELHFNGVSDSFSEVLPNRIMYVMFDYEYFDKTMPIGVIYLHVPTKMYEAVINAQKYATVTLRITGGNPTSGNSFSEVRMEHEFGYITVNQNQPYGIEDANDLYDEDKYRGLYIGLVDHGLTEYLRTPFNGIYYETTLQQLFEMATEGGGFKKLIEPILEDKEYDQVLVPACSTRKKLLDFLYDYGRFYDDYFQFFMDYDKMYLMSQSSVMGEDMTIDVRPVDDPNSYKSGIDGDTMYVNQMDVSINVNTASNQLTNKVVYYGERQNPEEYAISEGERVSFLRYGSNDEPGVEAPSQLKSASTLIEISKNNVSDKPFNPARVINLVMHDKYSEYSGRYKLYYKRVIYKIEDNEFVTNVNLGLIPYEDKIPSSGGGGGGGGTGPKVRSRAASNSARKQISSDNKPKVETKAQHNKARSKGTYHYIDKYYKKYQEKDYKVR
jgi:hypothetical protein